MLHCTFLNIPILVQPHGMLLKEALKSKSFLSYTIKLFTLFIFLLPVLDVTTLTGALPSGNNFINFDAFLRINLCISLASPFLKLSFLLNILEAGIPNTLAKAF